MDQSDQNIKIASSKGKMSTGDFFFFFIFLFLWKPQPRVLGAGDHELLTAYRRGRFAA